MISRGHFIGDLVDSLASISEQVAMRSVLGLYDLNRYLEDFFKEVLNRTLDLNLVNMNEDRSNAPGLDLKDSVAGVGFQITSQKSSDKINDTLEAVQGLDDRPTDIRILIIGKKQQRYTLEQEHADALSFTTSDIWDLTDLAKQIVGLPLDKLQDLQQYVSRELVRVKIDLEVPDTTGHYPTTLFDRVEAIPTPTVGDLHVLRNFMIDEHADWETDWPTFEDDLRSFITTLTRLPRVTREFYALLIERREDLDEYEHLEVDFLKLKRIFRHQDEIMEEIALLEKAGLITFYPPGDGDMPSITVRGFGREGAVLREVLWFMHERELSVRNVFVTLDLSAFGVAFTAG